MNWEDILRKGTGREWQDKRLKDAVCKLALGSAVYNIWGYRYDVKFGRHLSSEEKMLQKICWEVRTRIMEKGKFKKNDENVAICNRWSIPSSILI